MLRVRYISYMMPFMAGAFFLWYKKRKSKAIKNSQRDDPLDTNSLGVDVKLITTKEERPAMQFAAARGVAADAAPPSRDCPKSATDPVADDASIVALGSSLVSVAASPQMQWMDDQEAESQDESVDFSLGQQRVLDWAEERVSISEADLGADLDSLLQVSLALNDESPSSRRNRNKTETSMRSHGRTSSEASRASSDEGRRCAGDSVHATPTKSARESAWSSAQNTPDGKSPRNRKLKRTSLEETEKVCPVISCLDRSPGGKSTGGSESGNWRQNMGQWDQLSRSSHNSPTDRCSETSGDSGRGGSDGVPSITIASPGEIVIYEFEFPSELCGRLIGKGGRNLHMMMTDSDTRMALRKQPFREDHQIVSVTGRQEDVQEVLESIRHKFPKNRHPNVDLRPVEMPVPQDLMIPDMLPLSLPECVSTDTVVSAVVSAGHIFLQMPTHPSYPNLPRLDACMLACYSQLGSPPLPLPVDPGIICAAPQSGGWYRAQVVQLLPPEGREDEDITTATSLDASLRFIDYGGYARIPCSELRQIRSDFIALPFQAIECYLANIAPPSADHYDFPIEGAFHLEQLVKSSTLQAEVIAYAEDGIPYIHLYRSEAGPHNGAGGENRLLINKALVEFGAAIWTDGFLSSVSEDIEDELTSSTTEKDLKSQSETLAHLEDILEAPSNSVDSEEVQQRQLEEANQLREVPSTQIEVS